MTFELDRSLEILERTPPTLRALLGGVSDFWARNNYGDATFSPFDVVGHLLAGDRSNWMVRLRVILTHEDSVPFSDFDRYAMYQTSQGKSMDDLLDDFAMMRSQNLAELRGLNLTPAQLDLPGAHPDLGPVTLRHLLSAWTVHDLGHLHQIAKAMSYQFRDAVGPWRKFLTILPRE